VDGVPLAIELAAARLRSLTVFDIEARLQDCLQFLTGDSRTAVRRQRTLAATVDWSYQLLSLPERVLFRRLSVFAAGCTLEAAEQVCAGAGIERAEVLHLLSALVDQSLVIAGEQSETMRYRLLEPLRQFRRQQLASTKETTTTWNKHRNFYVRFAEQAELEILGPRQSVWLDRLEQEHDNFRSVLRSAIIIRRRRCGA
jgi:predicted ATPase